MQHRPKRGTCPVRFGVFGYTARSASLCGAIVLASGVFANPAVAASTVPAAGIRGMPPSTASLPIGAQPLPVTTQRPAAVTLPGAHTLIMDARTVRTAMPHVLFGTIVSVHGTTVLLRTRTGGFRTIEAAPAFAAGTVSLPLFVGKIVAIDGVIAADGTLTAARITRMTRLSAANRDR